MVHVRFYRALLFSFIRATAERSAPIPHQRGSGDFFVVGTSEGTAVGETVVGREVTGTVTTEVCGPCVGGSAKRILNVDDP